MIPPLSDLDVCVISDSLKGKHLDLVVSGSIAATESVRFVRCMRRLGATIHPWLTSGGKRFITEASLAWAAAGAVQQDFDGQVSHIHSKDACVVAPASVNLLAEILQGRASRPATALIQSYLGAKKPVLILLSTHDSLAASPFVQENLSKLQKISYFLEPRLEEGKIKFPDPSQLANQVSHILNNKRIIEWPGILVGMGTTRGYIDDIRYLSNYSSGSLGTHICEELYRQGFETHVVIGPCDIRPGNYSQIYPIHTNEQLQENSTTLLQHTCEGAIFLASVLDFIPKKRRQGKIKSNDTGGLELSLQSTQKILPHLQCRSGVKIGFKLEADFDTIQAFRIAAHYLEKYRLSQLVLNKLADVDAIRHQALIAAPGASGPVIASANGKHSIAKKLVQHTKETYANTYN